MADTPKRCWKHSSARCTAIRHENHDTFPLMMRNKPKISIHDKVSILSLQYGEVNFVVVSTRKKGSAVVEYKSPHSAVSDP